jgi:hypothetical protein
MDLTAAIQIAASAVGVIVLLIGGMLAYIIKRLGRLEDKIDGVRQDFNNVAIRVAHLEGRFEERSARRAEG